MKYDIAVAVKEQQKGKPENWYVAHVEVDGIAKETKDIQAIDKIRKTYEGQDDAALLDVQVLEVKEKLGDG